MQPVIPPSWVWIQLEDLLPVQIRSDGYGSVTDFFLAVKALFRGTLDDVPVSNMGIRINGSPAAHPVRTSHSIGHLHAFFFQVTSPQAPLLLVLIPKKISVREGEAGEWAEVSVFPHVKLDSYFPFAWLKEVDKKVKVDSFLQLKDGGRYELVPKSAASWP